MYFDFDSDIRVLHLYHSKGYCHFGSEPCDSMILTSFAGKYLVMVPLPTLYIVVMVVL